ncbi:hypothetical protein G7085_06565 [Tessaracoccus sp. HDW20]|uniref:FAD-dependent oxidoreductase n=1 Tax=Tessaracoccus coleopterorum TaxID=2714950 RepID=UPI0018D3D5C6|nr:FAD-dependent oxidoreductase [Tessaracoccus coleopterorum]NHB84381.1 hypothetical protein [Tessaracoccus coleopterorum]
MREIARISDDVTRLPLRDRSLPGGDPEESRRIVELFREVGAEAELLIGPDGPTIVSEALCVDPAAYGTALRTAAVSAGAQVVDSITVTHIARREGVTKVRFRDNRAWVREPGATSGRAVIDTLGISPWAAPPASGPRSGCPSSTGPARAADGGDARRRWHHLDGAPAGRGDAGARPEGDPLTHRGRHR